MPRVFGKEFDCGCGRRKAKLKGMVAVARGRVKTTLCESCGAVMLHRAGETPACPNGCRVASRGVGHRQRAVA